MKVSESFGSFGKDLESFRNIWKCFGKVLESSGNDLL
jgi:hypothetical protein